MASHQNGTPVDTGTPLDDDRRKFLAACGKFAVVTPPALTVLLSTSLNSKAIAQSGGRGDQDHGNNGGNGNNGNNGNNGGHPGGEDLFEWLEKLLGKLF
ncbi:MAG: hypothetical protein JWP25_4353 [Bradyrhizobium sp.]|jgi:hypothetical protein|nr:hypothetical protein [Bradyrhizobium sp.]